MRPGKPLIWGSLGQVPLLGLPGTPVSALVCAVQFLLPALARLSGGEAKPPPTLRVRAGAAMAANDKRFDHLRARLEPRDGETVVVPFDRQDSSMLKTLARADALVLRAAHAPAVAVGEMVDVIPLAQLGL